MMPQQTMTTLTKIFSDVIADLAFMFADENHVQSKAGKVWLETTISYFGPHNGALRFRCDREFTILLAANLLGIEPDDEDAMSKANDAVKEFMNILCGQLVTALHGTEEILNLSIAEVRKMKGEPDFSQDDGLEVSTLSVDKHLVQLVYTSKDNDVGGQ